VIDNATVDIVVESVSAAGRLCVRRSPLSGPLSCARHDIEPDSGYKVRRTPIGAINVITGGVCPGAAPW
jgi:hypothetical protein